MNRKTIGRTAIIQTISNTLSRLAHVRAFFEGGAVGFNRLDEWSDIDLYILVDDNKTKETFDAVEKALTSLSRITQKYDVPQTQWKNVSQAFFRLEGTSEYMIIDLAVVETSSEEKFLEPTVHGKTVFYINRDDCVRIPGLDVESLTKKIQGKIERMQARFRMFNCFVQKEINRGNLIEAMDLYYNLTLASLLEALRIQYYPVHYDFRTRYVHRELPKRVVRRLEHLYFVRNRKELQEKYGRATGWFHETIKAMNEEKTEKQLRALQTP